MTISDFRIQSILKTYRKTIRWTQKKAETSEEGSEGSHRVESAMRERKKRIFKKAASHVIERLTRARNATASFSEGNR